MAVIRRVEVAMIIVNGFAIAGSLDVKPVTVCEVLADPAAYIGKPIAVLGRFNGGNLIDGCCALVQDRCNQSVITDAKNHGGGVLTGYAWQNRVDLAEGAPISDQLAFGGPDFDERLRVAGMWTDLKCFDWPARRADGTYFTVKLREQWAVAYGTLKTHRLLHGPRGTPGTLSFEWGNGFGHLGAAPVQLVYSALKLIGSRECSEGR